jgi:uncharacterized protein (DUF1697 family)
MRSVALLRGLNLGAHNRIAMKDLISVFEGLGCKAVESYIQSGNVLFDANAALTKKLPELVAGALKKDFDITSPVVLRTGAELAAAVKNSPFLGRGAAAATLHIGFLITVPDAALVKALDPQRSPPDEFEVVGRDIHLRFPNGLGRSKLTNAWFDGKLKAVSTVRNWNTVLELTKRLAR